MWELQMTKSWFHLMSSLSSQPSRSRKPVFISIRDKLSEDITLHSRTNLTTDDIISVLEFVLSNNYFVYNDCIYKQIHGCVMGSPVSPVVANLCMEVIEDSDLSISTVPPKI